MENSRVVTDDVLLDITGASVGQVQYIERNDKAHCTISM